MSDPPTYLVEFTNPAEADLETILDYLVEQGAADVAEQLLERVLDKIASLETFPERGSIPGELLKMGVTDHRQLLLPPYRLIYQVGERQVSVVMIADGRRDMRELLRYRLLSR